MSLALAQKLAPLPPTVEEQGDEPCRVMLDAAFPK